MANLVEIRIKMPRVFTKKISVWNAIKEPLAAALQTNRGMLFMSSGRYNNHDGWAPLKFREGQPLLDSGKLSQSIAPLNDGKKPSQGADGILRFGAGVVTIGSVLPYAAMMNFGTTGLPGGVLRPKNKKALAFPIPNGFVICKSVKIPPRHFDDFTPADVEELEQTMANEIARLFDGRQN